MKNFSKLQIAGFVMCAIQFIVSAALLIQIVVLDFLPGRYCIFIGGALLIDVLIVLLLQLIKSGGHWVGKVISLITIIGLIIAIYMIGSADHMLKSLTGQSDTETNEIYVVVKKDSDYKTLTDVKDKKWGVQYAQDVELMGKTVDACREELGADLDLTAYDDYNDLYPDLMNGTVDTMIVGSAYLEIIDELSVEEDDPYVFSDEIRILKTYTFEEEVTEDTEKKSLDITKDTFTVFISGIDTYGDITTKSRSDVNILMTVNPVTKQILLVTTPRDAYTILPGVSGDSKDKLTHSGIYGIQCSIDTMNYIYGIDIDYYVRVNFSSVVEIVDALGGVDVYSAYDFTVGDKSFTEGYNSMDGETALTFARERHSFAEGDFQRGRDQMEVIKGIVNKCCSKAILNSYKDIMKVASANTQTDVKTSDIYKLVKMQLSDMASWETFSYETDATVGREYCYSYSGKSLSVSKLKEASVKQAAAAMKKMQKGKTLTGADVAQ